MCYSQFHHIWTIAVQSINTWCEMFTDDLPDFDTVPDIRTLHEMRGTTPTKGLETNDSEFDGKLTFVLTHLLLCTCTVISLRYIITFC